MNCDLKWVIRLKSMRNRRKIMLMFMMSVVCLSCSCGQAQREAGEEIAVEEDFGRTETVNDTIRKSICRYYGREEHEKVSEEEIEAVRGKLSSYGLTIHSGEEFALMREWYDWDSARNVTVYFSKDLSDWQEEDLQALKVLGGTVYVECDEETFPARALAYLTGVQRWQEKRMENGEVVEVRNSYAVSVEGEESGYPEVCESYYAQDSYWGNVEQEW